MASKSARDIRSPRVKTTRKQRKVNTATFDFALRFTGLCAFVKVTDHTMKVVLINARDKPMHGQHYAALLVDRASVDFAQTKRKINFGFDGSLTNFGSADMVGFLLEGEDFTIEPSASDSLKPNFDPLNSDCPDSALDLKSLHWMARMKEAGSGTMTKNAFETGGRDLVLARFTLTEGDLDSEFFADGEINNAKIVLRWRLTNDAGGTVGRERALTDVVKLTRKIDIQKKLIFRSSAADQDIFLKQQSAEAWIVNQPIDDVIIKKPVPPRSDDVHFHEFYKLSTVSGNHIPRPTNNVCIDTPVIGVSNPRCPVAFFADFQS